jgi:hypothetical protein
MSTTDGRNECRTSGLCRIESWSGVRRDNKKGMGRRRRGSSPRGVPDGSAMMARHYFGG